jgi:hypothetical protein
MDKVNPKHIVLGIGVGIAMVVLILMFCAAASHAYNYVTEWINDGQSTSAPLSPSEFAVLVQQQRDYAAQHADYKASSYDSMGLPTADLAARRMGYKNWNDYVEHRGPCKMGKDCGPAEGGFTVIQGPPTFPHEQIVDQQPTYSDVIDPGLVAVNDPGSVVTPDFYIPPTYPHGGGGCYDCGDTHYIPPTVSVPEPGSLYLMLAGIVGLFITRGKRHGRTT